jgi:hypothetical protein
MAKPGQEPPVIAGGTVPQGTTLVPAVYKGPQRQHLEQNVVKKPDGAVKVREVGLATKIIGVVREVATKIIFVSLVSCGTLLLLRPKGKSFTSGITIDIWSFVGLLMFFCGVHYGKCFWSGMYLFIWNLLTSGIAINDFWSILGVLLITGGYFKIYNYEVSVARAAALIAKKKK